MRQVDVKVGWGIPIDGLLLLNFHFTYLQSHWRETVPVAALLELQELISSSGSYNPADAVFPQEQLTTNADSLHALLSERHAPWNENTIDTLVGVTNKLENWLDRVLTNLGVVPPSAIQFIKQLFFRSKERVVIFEQLQPPYRNPASRR